MINTFLELGFRKVGHFILIENELTFERIIAEYNPSNVIWAVATEKEVLYVGETVDPINIVLTDLVNGNENRSTRNRIHALVKEYSKKSIIHFLVAEANKHPKQDLIEKFSPIGNINGK